jgi:hypothetical protein
MARTRRTALAGTALLLAAATWAPAEPFRDVKYLGGLPGIARTMGTLDVSGGALRFHDDKGRPVFARLLVPAEAWLGSEKTTSDGCMARNLALLPLLIPLAGSAGGSPWIGGCGRTRAIVLVRLGDGPDAVVVRLRAPQAQVRTIVDAINAATVAKPPAPEELGPVPE